MTMVKTFRIFLVAVFAFSLVSDTIAQGLLNRGMNRPGGMQGLRNSRLSSLRGGNRSIGGAAGGDAVSSTAVAKASAVDAETESLPSDLNFKDAPAEMVYAVYGNLVGRTVFKDPQTPSPTITLQSIPGQKLSKEDQIEAIEVIMEMNGIHFEPYGEKFVRAIPRNAARKEGIPLLSEALAKLKESGKVASAFIQFKNIPVEEAQKALEGFKSNSGLLQVFERTNKILVTDTQMNINRMMEIAQAIDIASPVLENVFVRQIKNASANDIKTALEQIVTESQKEQEKSGSKTQTPQQNSASRLLGGPNRLSPSLLRRNNQPQEAPKPENLASIVTSVSDADRGMIRGKVLIIADERSNKLIIVTMKANMDFFDRVIEQLDVETTPDMQVKIYRLKYAEAEEVSDMINDLIGNAASSKNTKQSANPQSRAGGGANLTRGGPQQRPNQPQRPQSGNGSRAGELSKENVTVLADKRINGLVVMARTQDFPAIEQIIESMDVRLSQVLIETMILQIQLNDEFSTGIDWVAGLGSRSKGQRLTGGGGKTPDNGLQLTGLDTLKGSPVARGLNYMVVSKSLDLGMVLNASKTDSRAKLVASPIIMTVDNKEATIKATKMRYLLKGYTYSGSTYNGSAVPDYEQKEIGLTVKVTPKINPNGTVMLSIEEEFSSLGEKQVIQAATGGTTNVNGSTEQAISGIDVETTVTRQLTADITVEDRQTVILGGLTQTEITESEGGIPFLKDIPWIGKYLFGSTTKTESRQELLMFLTPYVLDDADDAVAEARRRKKTLSDAKPWDDGGWSDSPLADEIGLKEQLKRKQREWQQQDEEYKIKQKLDKATEKRVELLKKQAEKAEKERKAKEAKAAKDEKGATPVKEAVPVKEAPTKEVPAKKTEPVKENAR